MTAPGTPADEAAEQLWLIVGAHQIYAADDEHTAHHHAEILAAIVLGPFPVAADYRPSTQDTDSEQEEHA